MFVDDPVPQVLLLHAALISAIWPSMNNANNSSELNDLRFRQQILVVSIDFMFWWCVFSVFLSYYILAPDPITPPQHRIVTHFHPLFERSLYLQLGHAKDMHFFINMQVFNKKNKKMPCGKLSAGHPFCLEKTITIQVPAELLLSYPSCCFSRCPLSLFRQILFLSPSQPQASPAP